MTTASEISLRFLYSLSKPFLMSLDAEKAHDLTLTFLRIFGQFSRQSQQKLQQTVEVAGIEFPNRVGLAAGFDKNGFAIGGLSRLGFGHLEIGGVTPAPQSGNEKPRLFRLSKDRAIINRMGFNNEGAQALSERLKALSSNSQLIIGVNLGKQASTPNAVAAGDFTKSISILHHFVDYFTVNVSSPNTAGLRDLQEQETLDSLLRTVLSHRDQLLNESDKSIPIFVKVAPDLDPVVMRETGKLIEACGCDGIIASNTSTSRAGLRDRRSKEGGGLSGAPLLARTLKSVELLRHAVNDATAIVGVGGIMSDIDAKSVRAAGADLVQVYSGLVYRGPKLVSEIIEAIG